MASQQMRAVKACLQDDPNFSSAIDPYLKCFSAINSMYFATQYTLKAYTNAVDIMYDRFGGQFRIPEILGDPPKACFPKWSLGFTGAGITVFLLASPYGDSGLAFMLNQVPVFVQIVCIFIFLALFIFWVYREIFKIEERKLRVDAINDLRAQAKRYDKLFNLD